MRPTLLINLINPKKIYIAICVSNVNNNFAHMFMLFFLFLYLLLADKQKWSVKYDIKRKHLIINI